MGRHTQQEAYARTFIRDKSKCTYESGLHISSYSTYVADSVHPSFDFAPGQNDRQRRQLQEQPQVPLRQAQGRLFDKLRGRLFDCVVRKGANDFAQDDSFCSGLAVLFRSGGLAETNIPGPAGDFWLFHAVPCSSTQFHARGDVPILVYGSGCWKVL
jgi:hypothetical protein